MLAGEALATYLAVQERQVEAIREALEAAGSGAKPIEHSAVAAWLQSWGSKNELARPW
jgi:predicted transcriptional regulator